jgi:hypothetical protein
MRQTLAKEVGKTMPTSHLKTTMLCLVTTGLVARAASAVVRENAVARPRDANLGRVERQESDLNGCESNQNSGRVLPVARKMTRRRWRRQAVGLRPTRSATARHDSPVSDARCFHRPTSEQRAPSCTGPMVEVDLGGGRRLSQSCLLTPQNEPRMRATADWRSRCRPRRNRPPNASAAACGVRPLFSVSGVSCAAPLHSDRRSR